MIGSLDIHEERKMFELISYCIIGGCLLWNLGLVLYLCIENAQEEAELEEILRQHARKEWQKISN